MRRSLAVAAAAVAAHALSGTPLQAQGSAVMTHSSCATAMGAAGVAAPCSDGSAVLFNPAGIATMPGVVGVGVSAITADGAFTYDFTGERVERDGSTTPVPFGFLTHRFGGGRLAAGIGVFAPYGLGLDWPEEFEGRFSSYDTELRNIYIQPTLAFQVNDFLAVGAGMDYVRASIDINQRVDLATLGVPGAPAGVTFGNLGVRPGTDFADVGLSGDGTGFGFNAGVTMTFERFSFGARYMSEVEIDYDGDADFTQINTGFILPDGNPVDAALTPQFQAGGPLADQAVSTGLTLPAQFVIGAAVRPMPRLQLLADYQWTGWSSFDQGDLDFENETAQDQVLVLDYQDTDTWRFGAEFGATDALALRAGFIYNTAAERDYSVSPLLPEAERNYYSLGLGYQVNDRLGIDVGYQLVDQSDRRGRVRGRPAGLDPENPADRAVLESLNVGVYESSATVLNLTVSYRFGGR